MRAVVIHETGGPEVLTEEEIDRPEPGDGEVLIRVHAASVNPVDWKQRQSMDSLPAVLGRDVSGTVEVSRADGFSEGDEVFGSSASGGYAEYSTAEGSRLAKKPTSLSYEQAAAIPVSGITAWQSLFDKGGLESGQTALIAGAAGGVGHFAVQFAKNAGALVLATASGRNREFLLGLGADEFIDYTKERPEEVVRDVDLVLDAVGGPDTRRFLPTLKRGGALFPVFPGGFDEEETAKLGVTVSSAQVRSSGAQLTELVRLLAAGTLRVAIDSTFALADAQAAHERAARGHIQGKIVLTVA